MDKRKLKIAAGLLVGGGIVTLLVSKRGDVYLALDAAKKAAFKLALPSPANQYADLIWDISAARGVSPLITYGIGDRESGWGKYLTPPGPGGTGDFAARNWTSTPMPPDGKGWGRGLMQLDYLYYADWFKTHDWTNPAVIIDKGLEEFNKHLAFFKGKAKIGGVTDGNTVTIPAGTTASRIGAAPGQYRDPRPLSGTLLWRAALAAYNGGDAYILRAIAAGKDPDTTTTGGDYSKHIIDRAIALGGQIGI